MFDIQLFGVKFMKPKQFGDFYWMYDQEEYSDSLFIFNDNEEYHYTCRCGAGNAVMRRYNQYSKLIKPKSAGIPTGTLGEGGYSKFTPEIKKVIDDSINEIIELIKIHQYKTIYFSAELDGKLGTSIFAVNPKVINYITNRIYGLTHNPVRIIKLLSNDNFEEDFEFDID